MTEFLDSKGNLLEAEVEALVNTVNTVGVMGKGIALQFKKSYPANFKSYHKACKEGTVQLGVMHIHDNGQLTTPRWIINFPTKGHWRSKSKMQDVLDGLDALANEIVELGISSIAVPPLGCGNGGLNWAQVEPAIRSKLGELPVTVHLYAPAGAPRAVEMPDKRRRPKLTMGKAALVAMIDRYSQAALGSTVVEVQKLMYFLQEAGQPLRLRYAKGQYGPYADNLRHVLIALEGHHLQGYGDGSSSVADAEPITVLPEAGQEAKAALEDSGQLEILERIDRALALTAGFESAYGLELLASVHWCAKNESDVGSASSAATCVRAWNERKASLFTDEHIEAAWGHLLKHGWLTSDEPPGAALQ